MLWFVGILMDRVVLSLSVRCSWVVTTEYTHSKETDLSDHTDLLSTSCPDLRIRDVRVVIEFQITFQKLITGPLHDSQKYSTVSMQ
jgi:hypothetical protein